MNSADTGIVGDTNGDGVVDGLDTGLVGECLRPAEQEQPFALNVYFTVLLLLLLY